MPLDTGRPDLAMTVPLDRYAPRSARQCIAQVDNPSPDLRDAVVLLCSELVTHAVQHAPGESAEMRVWMPEDIVRVELLCAPEATTWDSPERFDYALMLLDSLADRWEREDCGARTRVWFEIDRHRDRAKVSSY